MLPRTTRRQANLPVHSIAKVLFAIQTSTSRANVSLIPSSLSACADSTIEVSSAHDLWTSQQLSFASQENLKDFIITSIIINPSFDCAFINLTRRHPCVPSPPLQPLYPLFPYMIPLIAPHSSQLFLPLSSGRPPLIGHQ